MSWDDPGDESITGYEILRHGPEQKLVAPDRAESDKFGYSVAVDGDTLVVGAYRVDDGQGAAYVFSRQSDGAWSQVAKLTASERSVGDQFGQSVSIDGDVIVVGAVGDDDVAAEAGAAYVFKQPTAGWSDMNESKKLTATDGGADDWFGYAVDIDNDTMVVAAHQVDGYDDVLMKNVPNAGAVYVFAKPVDGAWADATQVAKLTSSKPKEDDQLGSSVAVSGDVVVAGAPVGGSVSESDYGTALVFVKPQAGWANGTENGVLTASDPTGGDRFGVSVDIDSDTIAVGALGHTAAASNSGAGYVFVKPDSGWVSITESAKLTASDAAQKDGLGSSIAIHGETILIGAFEHRTFSQGPGKTYIYTASAGGWANAAEMAKLTAMVRADGDNFGISVALDGSTILVGADGVDHEDGNNPDTGAVYVFDYEPSSEIAGSDAGTISHTVSGLVNYRTYSIAVRARNEAGPGPGVVVTATPGFLPAKPSGLIAYPDDDQVTLVWENPQDATIQRYEYKAVELVAEGLPGDWTVIDNSNASTTEHIVTSLNHDSKYAFQVRATNIVGTGPESDPVTIIVANRPPVFDVGESINLQIPENAPPGTPVGNPILATDPDNDSIQHAFGGELEDVGVFSFNFDTVQISVGRSLDYETKSVYSYSVDATDEHDASTRLTVTINVLDVDETPAGGGSEPTPEPTPTPTPTPVPPPTAQDILDLYAADPEQAAQALQELAETNPELAAQILLDLARQDPSAAQGIVLLLTSSDQGNAAFQQLLLSNPGQAAELLLLTSEEDPELAGELVGELAEENPEQAGQVIARSAQQDEEGTGQLICNAVGGHSEGTGRAVGHSAGEDADATGRALSTISGDSECVDQLGSTIPVQPWMPEQTPPEGADQTGRGEWQDVGSPAPIENVMARFASNIPGAKANITNLEDQPVGTSPLPSDSVPYAFVDIGHENFDNEDVVTAHATISVEKEWLTANQIHEWSVQLSRFDEPGSSWIPTQSKRIQEDDEKVYYSVTVPGFSLWAIHGNTEAPGLTFVEDNLRMSSSTAAPGDATIVSVDVTNTTTETANYFSNLWVDQQIDQTDQILIGPGETETINFTLVIVNAGTYQIRVGSQIGQQPMTVEGPVVPPTPVLLGSQVTAAPTPTAIEPLPTVEPTAAPTPAPAPSPEPAAALTPEPVAAAIDPTPTDEPASEVAAEPVLIGNIEFSNPNPNPGDQVVVTVPVSHTGSSEMTLDLVIEVGGIVVAQQSVTVPPGETIRVDVPIVAPSGGTTDVIVRVGNQSKPTLITPAPQAAGGNTGLIVGVVVAIVVVVVIVVIIVAFMRRRR